MFKMGKMSSDFYFTDTHCHLDSFEKRGILPSVLKEAEGERVEKIIACSTKKSDWSLYSNISKNFAGLVEWEIGIHPLDLDSNWREDLEELSDFARKNCPVAVGEIGLDFYRISPDKRAEAAKEQEEAFSVQIRLAKDLNLPVCVHARSAFAECVEILKREKFDFERVVFHCFSGTPKEMAELNSLGGRASFTGIITYKNASEMRESMLVQGLEKAMFETDSPYLSPLRGRENFPKNVRVVAEHAALLFGASLEETAEISSRNAAEFFSI